MSLARHLAAELSAGGITPRDLRLLVDREGAPWLAAEANDNADIEGQIDALLVAGFGFDFIREWADRAPSSRRR